MLGARRLGAFGAVLTLALGATGAQAAKPGAAAAPPAPTTESCDLQPSAHRSAHNEFASCVAVSATLSSAPAVGETARLSVSVSADAARDGARIVVDLPANLVWADAPAGADVREARSLDGTGAVRRAELRADLAPGRTRRLEGLVRAVSPGAAHVRVRAIAGAADGADAGNDDVFLTVGDRASRLGAAPVPVSGGVREVARAPVSGAPHRAVPLPRGSAPAVDPESTQATSCVSGFWQYIDQNGAFRPSRNYQVQVWDDDVFADDLLATGLTANGGASDGGYNLCFNGSDEEGGGGEIFVRFVSENTRWRVRDTAGGNNNYVNSTGVVGLCDGCSHDFGPLIPGNDIHRGLHAFDSVNDFWNWAPGGAADCWDALDATCRQVIVNWTSTSTDGTYYWPPDNTIHLAADDPNAAHVTIHETAHAVMDDVYEDAMPPSPSCNPHSVNGASSAGCAWVEGFAEWVPAAVLDDPAFRWPNGASLDLEGPTWGSGGWPTGDTTEGRVAGAMIDISDGANDTFWDRAAEGDPSNQWTTFLNQHSDTFAEFFLDRAAAGFETSDALSRASVYQNTIDYGFRDPLGNYADLLRPIPSPNQHAYSYGTATPYWSVVAIRPDTGDYDLQLFDDRPLATSLGSSAFGGNTVDFVAVDTNRRPQGDYYPRVFHFGGSGNYRIELAQGSDQLGNGSVAVAMGAGDVVAVRDSFVDAGVPTFFRVVPSGGTQDAELFVMQSDAANAATFVQGRPTALAAASAGGPGQPEALSITSPASQWDGVVLVNRAGSGTYTIYRDTTAPTGSVVIDGGAATASSPTVSLALGGTDAETGVDQMRISVDGVLDSEPWQAFAASRSVTLPGTGLQTVRVQYRNRAGMDSAIVSDDITVTSGPDLVEQSLTNPPASRHPGETFSLTDVVRNNAASTPTAFRVRYYLSADAVKSTSDKQLPQSGTVRTISGLAGGATNTGTKTVTVPGATKPGTWFVLVCADADGAVAESNEGNNCLAAATTLLVLRPDLQTTAVGNPPAAGSSASVFAVTDTAKNIGNEAAPASTTQYYLSLNTTRDAGDILLTGARAVPLLNPGITSPGGRNVTVPGGTPAGIYRLLACADDGHVVTESNEKNNCKASNASITIS